MDKYECTEEWYFYSVALLTSLENKRVILFLKNWTIFINITNLNERQKLNCNNFYF